MSRILFVLAAVALATGALSAAELKVLTAGAFKPVVAALAPAFEALTGHTVRIENDTASALQRRISQGEAFDVVVLTPAALQALAQAGRVAPGSVLRLARVGIGVAVKPAGRQAGGQSSLHRAGVQASGPRRRVLRRRQCAIKRPESSVFIAEYDHSTPGWRCFDK